MFYAAHATQPTETLQSALPLFLITFPMVGAVACGLLGRYQAKLRDMLSVCVALTVLAATLALYPLVSRGTVEFSAPGFMSTGLSLSVDFLSFIFAVLVSLVWVLVTAYSCGFMPREKASTRYFVFLLLTLGGCLGVFLAADFISLFLCFEAMTLFSYVLVVHAQDEKALRAGRTYLLMGIFGGLCLLSAILLLQNLTGSQSISPGSFSVPGVLPYALAALFFIGFGTKAAAVPLHIWIPGAYEASPLPVNAISSAAMIKAGAYGLIRVFLLLLAPKGAHLPAAENLGYAIILIGTLTMFSGAVLALAQANAKRVLAYSSVSQMGYIIMGIGAAAYLGYHGATGFAGLTYHILNHAFFKAAMFLMLGTIYLRTKNLDYTNLGGLARKLPVTMVSLAIAGAAISGIPGLNGFASKTLLHHAIVEAATHHGSTVLWLCEKIFVVTSGLTFCYIVRLLAAVFSGAADNCPGNAAGETYLERLVFGVFSIIILMGGLLPGRVIKQVITPMAGGFNFDSHGVAHLADISIWNIHDIWGLVVSLTIGAVVLLWLYRRKFSIRLPDWLSLKYCLYNPVLHTVMFVYTALGRLLEELIDGFAMWSVRPAALITLSAGVMEQRMLPRAGEGILRFAAVARDFSHSFVTGKVMDAQSYIRGIEVSVFETMIKLDYNPRGEQLYRRLTLMNLDLCVFVVVIVLVIAFIFWLLKMMGL